jgi:hypothetical protein
MIQTTKMSQVNKYLIRTILGGGVFGLCHGIGKNLKYREQTNEQKINNVIYHMATGAFMGPWAPIIAFNYIALGRRPSCLHPQNKKWWE